MTHTVEESLEALVKGMESLLDILEQIEYHMERIEEGVRWGKPDLRE